jgi:hypothetical protein
MTVWELLSETRRLAIVLHVEGDQLRVRAPKGALTPELQKTMAAHKGELLRLYTPTPEKEPPPPDLVDGLACPNCGGRKRWLWIDGSMLCYRGVVMDDHLGRSWPGAALQTERCGWCGTQECLEAFESGRVHCMNCHAVWNPSTQRWHPGERAKRRQYASEENGQI